MERDDLQSGFTRLDWEASERKAIYDRLVAIENKLKKRGSRGFARYLVAILIGVAATLAWQSHSDAAKQVIARSAPELGWSPEAKQMIAGWVQQLGWTKPLAVESKAAPVAQTAPETVAPKAPAASSLNPAQVQQMALDLATLRQTVDRLAVGLDEVNREIGKLEVADEEILAKVTPAPPPAPPIAAAPAVAGRPAPGGSSANTQTEVALRANCGPDVQRLCRGISWENGGVIKCLNSHRMEVSPICVAHFNGQKGTPKATNPNR